MKINDTVVHTLYPDVRQGRILAISDGKIKVMWGGNLARPSGTSEMGWYHHPARFIQRA